LPMCNRTADRIVWGKRQSKVPRWSPNMPTLDM
jgi:hypothetical protein